MSHVSLSRNLQPQQETTPSVSPGSRMVTPGDNRRHLPFSQDEIVRFDVPVDDFAAVQLLHHVKDFDGEVDDEGLGHHLLWELLVNVDGILEVRDTQHGLKNNIFPKKGKSSGENAPKEWTCSRAEAGGTHEQRSIVVELPHQNAAIGEEMGGIEVDVEVAHAGAQPLQQLGSNVELPRVGRFLDLEGRRGFPGKIWEC